MRILGAFLFAFLLSALSIAQKRYLVSPNQEVIQIPAGGSAMNLIQKYNQRNAGTSTTDQCSGEVEFGFDPARFPVDRRFDFGLRDVMGEWFVAPARGTIDTFFFQTNGSIRAVDSLVAVRIFKSNISPGHGPGFEYPRPCRSWGYWRSSNDQENGIAAFPEDATDTSWHSTIETNGGTNPSFAPFGSGVWGMTGFPVKLKPNATNAVPMEMMPGGFQIKPHSPSVKDTIDIGETFFFSLKMNASQFYISTFLTEFSGNSTGGFPSRTWRFFEHDSGPTPTCSGTPAAQLKKGWYDLGPESDDTTTGWVYNIWYVMTPTTNVPPHITVTERPEGIVPLGIRTISAEIFDCDAENPARTGVQSSYVRYRVINVAGNALFSGTSTLDNAGGDIYSVTMP